MSERPIGIMLTVLGALLTLIGAAMYVLPRSGFPFLVLGVALLTTGSLIIKRSGT
ncbi:hypothetical protein [Streptomyces sp. NPDC002692]